MKTVEGKNNSANVYTDLVEPEALAQVKQMCDQEFVKGSHIAIMPDVHAGAGCTIGTTMTITDKVCPNLVGVDIGCFTKDTKVALADGRNLSFEELIKDETEHYGYSLDKNGHVQISKLEFPRKIKETDELLEIELDNGEKIKCTTDHIFYKRDLSQVDAKDLCIGDSLYPLYIKKQNELSTNESINCKCKKFNLDDYLCIYDVIDNNYKYVHWLADNYNQRNGYAIHTKNFVRHHKDFNKYNNNPTNIVRLSFVDHYKIHAAHASELNRQEISGFLAAIKKHPVLCSNAGKFGSYNLWHGENAEIVREKVRNSIINYNKSEIGRNKSRKRQLKNNTQKFSEYNSQELFKNRIKLAKIRKIFSYIISQNEDINECNYNKYRKNFYNCFTWNKVISILNMLNFSVNDVLCNKEPLNHKIVAINHIYEHTDVYCLTCQEYGNFALASGCFVHNCGMLVYKFDKNSKFVRNFDPVRFDTCVRTSVPAGFNIHEHNIVNKNNIIHKELKDLIAPINYDRAIASVGTLGGGNHFIEVDNDEDDNLYIVVHCGSRHLGVEVCKYYQDLAFAEIKNNEIGGKIAKTIAKLKAEGKSRDIDNTIKILKMQNLSVPKDLAYVTGDNFHNYMHDMEIAQEYANINREHVMRSIMQSYCITEDEISESFCTVHNYIDIEYMILRKGAVSAQLGERLIIPMNMRDGSLICIGKGNPDWNYSAPHGAGRLMSRGKARESISLDKFRKSMDGIYTTSVCKETIDEAPFAYKPMQSIVENIGETVDIERIIKPIYNFKAAE